MSDSVLQPSDEPGATRLAIAYDILHGCGKVKGDPKKVAVLLGELVKIMLDAEQGR